MHGRRHPQRLAASTQPRHQIASDAIPYATSRDGSSEVVGLNIATFSRHGPVRPRRILGIAVTFVLFLGLAAAGAAGWSASYVRHFTPLAHEYLTAAERGDSARVASLSDNTQPVEWASRAFRDRSEFLRASDASLHVSWGGRHDDSLFVVEYAIDFPVCSPYGGDDHLQFVFARHASQWHVRHVGVPPC